MSFSASMIIISISPMCSFVVTISKSNQLLEICFLRHQPNLMKMGIGALRLWTEMGKPYCLQKWNCYPCVKPIWVLFIVPGLMQMLYSVMESDSLLGTMILVQISYPFDGFFVWRNYNLTLIEYPYYVEERSYYECSYSRELVPYTLT